jgi:hypothetical protein
VGDPVARVLQRSNVGGEDPVAKMLQGSPQQDSDPVARLLGQIPPSSNDAVPQLASTEEVPINSLRDLPRRYGAAVKEIVANPGDAIVGMAKSVFFDAMKSAIAPIKPLLPKEFVQDVYPSLAHGISAKEYGGALLRTGLNIGVPAARTFTGAALLGAGAGALSTPDDPLLGAALGGTVGPVVHGGVVGTKALARQVGTRAGSKKISATGAPPANTKNPAPQPAAPPPPEPQPVRDLSNLDVLKMTPQGIEILAQQAAKEEAALYTQLFGTKGARRYRAAVRRSTSASESPETAAKALAAMETMKSQLTETQQRALDEINARGFTSKRLKNIARITKDYSPEVLAKVDDTSLVDQFGEVLMTKNPDRNLSGLYRLQALYKETQARGIPDDVLVANALTYMRAQGVKEAGLGKLVVGKMADVRKTLEKIAPESVPPSVAGTAVTPDLPTSTAMKNVSPEAAALMEKVKAGGGLTPEEAAVLTREAERIRGTGVTKQSLGPISESQFDAELAAITPKVTPQVDDGGAARVAAARTTPFPRVDPVQQKLDALKSRVAQGERVRVRLEPKKPILPDGSDAYINSLSTEKLKTIGKELADYNDWAISQNLDSPDFGPQIRRIRERLFAKGFDLAEVDRVTKGEPIFGEPPKGTAAKTIAEETQLDVAPRVIDQPISASPLQDQIKGFVKSEEGFLNLDAFTDPLQTKINKNALPTHSKNIQDQIEVGYKPPKDNPLRPIEGYYAALVRRTAPLEKNVRQVEKANNIKVAAKDNPAVAVQLLAGWAGKAQHFLQFGGFREVAGQIVPTGNKGLEQILNGVGDYNAFRRLAIAERVAELDAQGRKVETGISTADAVQEISNATPGAKQAVAEAHQYLDGVLQYAEDASLLDAQTTAVLRQLGRAYVPLDRVLTKGAKNTGNIQYSALSTPQQFRTLVGSKLKIVDPIYSIADYTRRIIRASELNKVGQTIIDYVQAHPNETKGWLVREKNVSATNAPNVVATGQGIQQIAKQL